MNSKLNFLISLVIFKVILECSYIFVISDTFEYSGFSYKFDYIKYFLGWVLILSSFPLLNYRLIKVRDYYFLTSVLFLLTPLVIIYSGGVDLTIYPVIVFLLSLYITYIISNYLKISFRKIVRIKSGLKISILISCSFVVFLIFWYFLTDVKVNFNLKKVYDFRIENAKISATGILSYTNNWTYKIFNMFLFAIALYYKKYFLSVAILLIQVFFFGASAHKAVLFYPILILTAWFYLQKSNKLVIIPYLISFVILLTILSYFIYGDIALSSFFSRRVFFVPANLTYVYFDFFSQNEFIYWSNSVLSRYFEYPYYDKIPNLIGGYMGLPDMAANNGYLSTGYAHAGVFGVILYSVIIGLILKLIDDISENKIPIWLATSLCIIPLRNLVMASDLFTVLLTHGLFVAILLMYVSSSEIGEKIEK